MKPAPTFSFGPLRFWALMPVCIVFLDDCFRLILIDADWSWLILIDSDWFWLILIDSDWFSLILIGVNWFWLILIDLVWCWLVLIDADWWWLRWLMLFDADSYRCHRVTHVGAYPRPLDVHYYHCYRYFRKILDSSAASSLLIGIHSHISATPPFAAMLMIPVQNICISDTLLTLLATRF